MRIGIIGSGKIGGTLGKHWTSVGHSVMFSSRHPQALEDQALQIGAQAGTPQAAAAFGDIILLAVPFGEIAAVAHDLGDLSGKILIDATNPFPERDGEIAQQLLANKDLTNTGYTAQQFATARVVKAFNSIYYQVLDEEAFREGDNRIAIQIAGEDAEAKKVVTELISDIGFVAQDLGGLMDSIYFEPGGILFNQNIPLAEAKEVFRERVV